MVTTPRFGPRWGWATRIKRAAFVGSSRAIASFTAALLTKINLQGTVALTGAASLSTMTAGSWFRLADPWSGVAFGSRPAAAAGQYWPTVGDKGGAVILSNVRFTNRAAGVNVIVLDGVSNAIIEDIDFDTVPECIYMVNCSNVTIRRIRVSNLFGPFTRTGFHSGNLVQMVNCTNITLEDLKLVQPATVPPEYTATNTNPADGSVHNAYGTEDIISIGGTSSGIAMRRFAFNGGAWNSWSGTGAFLSDGDQAGDILIEDGILLNPGQCAFGTGAVTGPFTFRRIDIKSTRTDTNQALQLRTTSTSQLLIGSVRVDWYQNNVIGSVPYTDLSGNNFAATLATPSIVL